MKKEFEKEQKDNQIDDAFLDMPDMEDDEKFRQWLEEEYLKEADAIEDAERFQRKLLSACQRRRSAGGYGR